MSLDDWRRRAIDVWRRFNRPAVNDFVRVFSDEGVWVRGWVSEYTDDGKGLRVRCLDGTPLIRELNDEGKTWRRGWGRDRKT